MTDRSASPLDLRTVAVADVFKAGRLAGHLRRDGAGNVELVYDPTYLDDGGRPVAATLPTRREPYVAVAGTVPPFFAGLLPEGFRLQAVAAHVKTSLDDMLSLLLAVGPDTVGDVQVVPSGEALPTEPSVFVHAVAWNEVSFHELLQMSTGGAVDRVGLPGVQDKLSAAMISFPAATAMSRYIVKLEPADHFPRLVQNEHFSLRAARRAGLEAARTRLVTDRDGVVGLLVTRFDRVVEPGAGVQLVEQEDACQLLGRWPADKYRLTTEEVVAGVAARATSPVAATATLFRLFVFSYLIGNGDLHAKNVSLYHDPSSGLVVPTPAYDLVSSTPYGDHEMALSVAGRKTGLTRARWLQLADAVGLPVRTAERTLDEVRATSERWSQNVDEIGFDERKTHKLLRGIEHRLKELTA